MGAFLKQKQVLEQKRGVCPVGCSEKTRYNRAALVAARPVIPQYRRLKEAMDHE